MQVGRRRNLRAHPSVRTSRVCRNPKSDRPFFNTAQAVIDCNKGNVTFHVNGNEHTVHFPRKQPQVHSINSIGKIPSIIFGGFEFPLPTVKKKYDILIVGDVHIPVEVTQCYSKILRFHVIRNEFVNKT